VKVGQLVKYLRQLYQPGTAMISFKQEFVTMPMLGQLVLSVVKESNALVKRWGGICTCPEFQPMLPVYKSLAELWKLGLERREEDIMERLLSC